MFYENQTYIHQLFFQGLYIKTIKYTKSISSLLLERLMKMAILNHTRGHRCILTIDLSYFHHEPSYLTIFFLVFNRLYVLMVQMASKWPSNFATTTSLINVAVWTIPQSVMQLLPLQWDKKEENMHIFFHAK